MSDASINRLRRLNTLNRVAKFPSAISQFFTLVAADLTLQRRERGTWWLAAAVTVLLIAGAWQGADHVKSVSLAMQDATSFEANHVSETAADSVQFFANRDAPENKARPSWRNA